jgi:hypothetical protein
MPEVTMIRAISTTVFLMLILAACGGTASRSTSTHNACAGATDQGAREKFGFEQIIPCLNTTSKTRAFMANNVIYDVGYDTRARGGNEYAPAPVVYRRGIDDADGYAILQCYFLEKNGFDAFVIGMSIESPSGSNACGVRKSDRTILVLEGTGEEAGPFRSFTDLAAYYTSKHWMLRGGTLRTLEASQVTRITTDRTRPSVLGLPWISQRY